MADILISQLPRTTVADGEDLLIIDTFSGSGAIVTNAIALKNLVRDVQFADGNAVEPSITFVNDTNTGLYRVGDDTIGFTTSGINRMVIGPTGNVGIGTLTPTEKLTVANGKISVQSGGNNELLLEARDGGAGLTQKSTLPLIFATNDTKRVEVDAFGAVLINTDVSVQDVQLNVEGGSLLVNGADFNGTDTGEVKIGYRTTGYKELLTVNFAGAIANAQGIYGLPGQVLTSQGMNAPVTWSTPTGGGGGGTADEPFTNPGPTEPDPKVYGQFWYNSNEEVLYIWQGTEWEPVGGSGGGSVNNGDILPPNADEGDLFWSTLTKKLYAWDNDAGEWVIVGPQNPDEIEIGGGITFPTTFIAAASLPDSSGILTQSDLNQWLVNSVGYLEEEKVEESPADAKVYGRKTDGGVSEWVEVEVQGIPGNDGTSATVDVGAVNTGDAGTPVVITNTGPDEHNAIFNFTIPKGDPGEDGEPGTGIQLQGSFNYVGPPVSSPEADSPNDGDLWIDSNGDGWAYDGANWNNVGPIQGPEGPEGEAATITIGSTTTGAPGTDAIVSNTGDTNDAILEFTIPRGDEGPKGEDGDPGTAATVTVHSTETGLPGSLAAVTNEGTTSAAEFKFVIPRGDEGQQGPPGDPQKVHVGDTAPSGADEGDLWYETDTDTLKILVGGTWVPVSGGGGATPSPIEPGPDQSELGDLWYNTNNDKVYYYDGANWVEIAVDGDYVDLTTNQTVGGTKTFTEKITGSIDLATDCSRSVLVGDGLNGGGELDQDITVAVDLGDGLGFVGTSPNTVISVVAGDDTITVDAQGVKANVSNLFDPAENNAVISFNGRKGTVVPAEGDYTLNQLDDVDTTTSGEGYVLTQVGTQWLPREISIPGTLVLIGTIDATTEDGPAADHGDYYINTATGNFKNDPSWGSLATTAVSDGDMIAKLEAPNEWAVIGNSGGSGGGVNSITAINGVTNTGTASAVVLEADNTVVRTTDNQTINGVKTFSQPIVGDITGEAVDCSRRVLAGVALTGGGQLNTDITLDVNYNAPLTITSDALGISLGDGLVVVDGDLAVDDAHFDAKVGDGKIEFEEGAGGGISLSGDLIPTANQTADTKITIQCDGTVVRTSSPQTIGGVKTFTDQTLLDSGYIAGADSSIDGTFGVTGLSTLTGGYNAGADSSVDGTFGVTGLSTLTGGFSAGADSSVTGKITTTSTASDDPGTTLVTKDYLEGSNGLAGQGLQQVLTVGNISDKSIELTDGNDLIHIDPQLNRIIVGGSDDSSTPTIELANYDGDAAHDNKFYVSLVDTSTSVDFGSSTGVTTYDFHFHHDDPVIQFTSSGKITAESYDIESLPTLP